MHRWANSGFLIGILGMLSSLMTGCATEPQAEIHAQQAELRTQATRVAQMGKLSALAYLTEEKVADCPKIILAYPKTECFAVPISVSSDSYKAVYLIQTDDKAKEQIVAIRGTDNWNDAWTDYNTKKTPDVLLGNVPDHRGFQIFSTAIYNDAIKRLNPRYKIFTTGHSLGGAAALLLGLYLYVEPSEKYQVAGVYTFGQPKVFGNEGVTSWPFFSRRVFRVVDCDDPVPIVPTSDSKFNLSANIGFLSRDRRSDYQHMGESLVLLDRGQFWMPGSVELERSFEKTVKDTFLAERSGQDSDHRMTQYTNRLAWFSDAKITVVPANPANGPQCSGVAPRAALDVRHYGNPPRR